MHEETLANRSGVVNIRRPSATTTSITEIAGTNEGGDVSGCSGHINLRLASNNYAANVSVTSTPSSLDITPSSSALLSCPSLNNRLQQVYQQNINHHPLYSVSGTGVGVIAAQNTKSRNAGTTPTTTTTNVIIETNAGSGMLIQNNTNNNNNNSQPHASHCNVITTSSQQHQHCASMVEMPIVEPSPATTSTIGSSSLLSGVMSEREDTSTLNILSSAAHHQSYSSGESLEIDLRDEAFDDSSESKHSSLL